MRTCLECIPCLIRQALDAARMVSSDEKSIEKVMKQVLKASSEFDLNLTPPEMGQIVHRIIRNELGNSDPYFAIKEQSTMRALKLSSKVEELINNSIAPFETAVRFAIAGNIMDFGAKSKWDEDHIMNSFDKALTMPVDITAVDQLYQKIAVAEKVLVLGDNAGEVVFDKLLITQFPGNAEVIYAVKDSAVINDVTRYEAERSGIAEFAKIISNGLDMPGTAIKRCSKEFIKEFNEADVVISKGQGNFETLNADNREIFFLLQIKCQVIADSYDYSLGDWLVCTADSMKEMEVK